MFLFHQRLTDHLIKSIAKDLVCTQCEQVSRHVAQTVVVYMLPSDVLERARLASIIVNYAFVLFFFWAPVASCALIVQQKIGKRPVVDCISRLTLRSLIDVQ